MTTGTRVRDVGLNPVRAPVFFSRADCSMVLAPLVVFGIREVRRDTTIEGTSLRLASDLVVELLREESGFIARTYIVDEYGIGETEEAAVRDLLTSLAEYLASLESRQLRLSEPMLKELLALRSLFVSA